mmetsp:Transcript_7284/g.9086  ORF Transcript_7284/g.9086 Transcript_7284/m.9086 type:complete len:83 (+) Transcript_7284:379-627(+)
MRQKHDDSGRFLSKLTTEEFIDGQDEELRRREKRKKDTKKNKRKSNTDHLDDAERMLLCTEEEGDKSNDETAADPCQIKEKQ